MLVTLSAHFLLKCGGAHRDSLSCRQLEKFVPARPAFIEVTERQGFFPLSMRSMAMVAAGDSHYRVGPGTHQPRMVIPLKKRDDFFPPSVHATPRRQAPTIESAVFESNLYQERLLNARSILKFFENAYDFDDGVHVVPLRIEFV